MIKRLLLVILLSVSAQTADAQMQLRLVQQPATLHRLLQERQALQAQQDRRQKAFLDELDHLRSEDLQRRATLAQQQSPQDHLQDLQQNQQLQIQLQQQQQFQQRQLLQQHLQQQQPANLPPNPPAGLGR